MNEEQHMEDTLWNYIDGSLDKEAFLFVEKRLQTDAEWKIKYLELMELHQLMHANTEWDQPSLRFTQNVMEEISRLYISPSAKKYINKNVIWGITIFFLATIIGLLGYGFGQIDWHQPIGGNSSFDVSRIDWSRLLNSSYLNAFIMVNIILALMLFDMFLTNRKKKRETDF